MDRTPRQKYFARTNAANELAAFDRRQATIRERREAVQSAQSSKPSEQQRQIIDARMKRIAAKCDPNILRALLGAAELNRLGIA